MLEEGGIYFGRAGYGYRVKELSKLVVNKGIIVAIEAKYYQDPQVKGILVKYLFQQRQRQEEKALGILKKRGIYFSRARDIKRRDKLQM